MKTRFDYAELQRLIKYKYGSNAEFAEAVGMPVYCLYNRLKGKSNFKQSEIWDIANKLDIPEVEFARYFFTVATVNNEEE